jgi:hypothetical protein
MERSVSSSQRKPRRQENPAKRALKARLEAEGSLRHHLVSRRAAVSVSPLTCEFELLLHKMHHDYSSNKDKAGKNLVRVERCVKDPPCDAHGRECLHHFKIASR